MHACDGECLDGVDLVAAEGEVGESGEMDVADVLHQCCLVATV